MDKSIFRSRTFWYGLSVTVIGAAWPVVSPYIPPEIAIMVTGVGTVVLRYLTTTGVVVLPPSKQ